MIAAAGIIIAIVTLVVTWVRAKRAVDALTVRIDALEKSAKQTAEEIRRAAEK